MKPQNPVTPRDELRDCVTHLRQTVDAIAAAQAQRAEFVAAGNLVECRKIDARIADLMSDKRALFERRGLLARQAASAELQVRLLARNVAIDSEVEPKLEAVLKQIAVFEGLLAQAALAYGNIKTRFVDYTRAWPAQVPPPRFGDFTLEGLSALMKQALNLTGRQGDFEFIMGRFHGDELPSVALRRQVATFLEDLRTQELPAKAPAEDVVA
jgi:hypothetical protein